jgi:hypothetical protein
MELFILEEQQRKRASTEQELLAAFPLKNKQSAKMKYRNTKAKMLTSGIPLEMSIYEDQFKSKFFFQKGKKGEGKEEN